VVDDGVVGLTRLQLLIQVFGNNFLELWKKIEVVIGSLLDDERVNQLLPGVVSREHAVNDVLDGPCGMLVE